MPEIAEVCRHIRSKNAGPFWITVDFFFKDAAAFAAYAEAPALQSPALAERLGTGAAQIKRHALPDLQVLKISYPRAVPQGGRLERDMHGGQQYVRLLTIEV